MERQLFLIKTYVVAQGIYSVKLFSYVPKTSSKEFNQAWDEEWHYQHDLWMSTNKSIRHHEESIKAVVEAMTKRGWDLQVEPFEQKVYHILSK